MKKIVRVLAIVICMLSLFGCSMGNEESTSESIMSSSNVIGFDSSMPIGESSNSTYELDDSENIIFFEKYIQPLYIVGGTSKTWTNPNELTVEQLIKFYEYNIYYKNFEKVFLPDIIENPDKYKNITTVTIPAEDVEQIIMSYFKVDSTLLRTSERYIESENVYTFPIDFGIGGGPGLSIIQVEDSENIRTFLCEGEGTNTISLTIEIVSENQFFYISNIIHD